MEKKKKESDMARVCDSCGSENVTPFRDETGFHFKCIDCGGSLVYEVPHEALEKLKKK